MLQNIVPSVLQSPKSPTSSEASRVNHGLLFALHFWAELSHPAGFRSSEVDHVRDRPFHRDDAVFPLLLHLSAVGTGPATVVSCSPGGGSRRTLLAAGWNLEVCYRRTRSRRAGDAFAGRSSVCGHNSHATTEAAENSRNPPAGQGENRSSDQSAAAGSPECLSEGKSGESSASAGTTPRRHRHRPVWRVDIAAGPSRRFHRTHQHRKASRRRGDFAAELKRASHGTTRAVASPAFLAH